MKGAAVDDTPLSDARSAREGEMAETANYPATKPKLLENAWIGAAANQESDPSDLHYPGNVRQPKSIKARKRERS